MSHYPGVAGSLQEITISPVTTLMIGPRLNVSLTGKRLFAHALFGGEHSSNGGYSCRGLIYDLGGGIDFRLMHFLAWRVDGDYIAAPNSRQA